MNSRFIAWTDALRGKRGRGNPWSARAQFLGLGTMLVVAVGAGGCGRQFDLSNIPDVGVDSSGIASQTADASIIGNVLQVRGTDSDDKLTLRLRSGDANVIEVDLGDDGHADFTFNRNSFTKIDVQARNGNDLVRVDEANGTIGEPTSIRGENGNDQILGGSAIETIDGGNGDDFIDGNKANDVAFMGEGNDTFRWDPGDGSDVVEGDDGNDTLLFNGANVNEQVTLSANGSRFKFFRVQANITMDVNDVETSVFNALGGQDTITVNDLTGTDVTQVDLNLAAAAGAGDGSQDEVVVNGTAAGDAIVVAGGAGSVNVTGLSAAVAITATEAANDLLTVNSAGGNDSVDASGLQADAIKQLSVDGEGGNDLILGGRGADVLRGGDGNDFIDGNQANDAASMGAGNDTFRWDPGDGSDLVEGGDDTDTLLFNGANANEQVTLSANGERFKFFRVQANITMDVNDVETSVFNALGGQDTITVNDLTGTDVTQVDLNLGAAAGSGDGSEDQVVLNGTAGDDDITVKGSDGNVDITGLSAAVAITAAEGANDRLDVNTLAGNDTVDSSALDAGVIQLFVDGVAQ